MSARTEEGGCGGGIRYACMWWVDGGVSKR